MGRERLTTNQSVCVESTQGPRDMWTSALRGHRVQSTASVPPRTTARAHQPALSASQRMNSHLCLSTLHELHQPATTTTPHPTRNPRKERERERNRWRARSYLRVHETGKLSIMSNKENMKELLGIKCHNFSEIVFNAFWDLVLIFLLFFLKSRFFYLNHLFLIFQCKSLFHECMSKKNKWTLLSLFFVWHFLVLLYVFPYFLYDICMIVS